MFAYSILYTINDVKYHSSLKAFFIISEHVVSYGDHYHVSVHATVTSMHLYEMCMDFIRTLALCVSVLVCAVHSGWPGGISDEALDGGQRVFSHKESLTAGCSPGKAVGESLNDPKERPTENTNNWLRGSRCPVSLCHDKDKLHPPPLKQKDFGALGF